MSGIKDLIKTYRGENINLNPFRKRFSSTMNAFGKARIGRYSTTSAKEAIKYTSRFPNKILSTKITPLEMKIGKKMFHEMLPDYTDTQSGGGVKTKRIPKKLSNFPRDKGGRNYNMLSKKNLANLKIDPLKTFLSNAKALTPLAAEGLSFISSLPVATLAMVLQSTPANADEVNMKLEDFAKMADEAQPKNVNMDKALPAMPHDI